MAQLGKDKGKAVCLMVHHSRNSVQKQWDETLVLCLSGMGRLLRTHLPVVSGLEGFGLRWDALMSFCEAGMASSSAEAREGPLDHSLLSTRASFDDL